MVLSFFASAAHAQGGGSSLYLGIGGGGAGYGSFDGLCRDITGALPGQQVVVDCEGDETVFGWKVFGGWRVSPFVAIEVGYADFGKADGDTRIFGQDVNGKIAADAWFAELVGSLPLGEQGRVFGKLGIATVDAKLTTDVFPVPLATGSPPQSSYSTDSTDVVYGVGGELRFTERVLGRLEWERFDFEGGIDLVSVSIVFQP